LREKRRPVENKAVEVALWMEMALRENDSAKSICRVVGGASWIQAPASCVS
jgi:hypothetical protein